MTPDIAARMFKNLVAQARGTAAAAAIIESAVGHSISEGSLSRISNGNAEVPMLWAWALMDAVKNPCFDTYRAQTREATADGCPYELTGEASKEHGEAIEWGLKAARSSSAKHWSRAAVEYREAATKHTEMANLCEARAETVDLGKRA
ncbi:hypothetical protein [Ponticoccus litoralis]|uniref:Uncharacterized protein n=1 Tax=Ponticoccus litoralis TaxID=422297 RepID=A0AAW9SIP5_9RHOB